MPLPGEGSRFAPCKVSKRREEDITASLGAFHLMLDAAGNVAHIRIAYGGMAATPKRAHAVETALMGKPWTEATVEAALEAYGTGLYPADRYARHGGNIACLLRATCCAVSILKRPTAAKRSAPFAARRRERRQTRTGIPAIDIKTARIRGGVATEQKHDSAHKHVTGTAVYIDDIPEPEGTLHIGVGYASVAHGRIKSMDLKRCALRPAWSISSPARTCRAKTMFRHRVCMTIRSLRWTRLSFTASRFCGYQRKPAIRRARRAARLAKIEYEEAPGIYSIDMLDGLKDRLVTPPLTLERGNARAAIDAAPHRIRNRMYLGGQDHFYLEGQVSLAVPGEDEDVTVYCSTQGPSETQHLVAHALGVSSHSVTVEVCRMGGGFGGKETQANQWAAIAAKKHKRAVKIRPDRDEDMTSTGKRHGFVIDYEAGFDDDGTILGVDYLYALNAGFSADLSGPVGDRALFHCDNAYFYPAVHAQSAPLYTNTVSNTAFRGFGGPQGMAGAERVIDEVAFALGKDPLEIRKRNFYDEMGKDGTRNVTPYHQKVEDCIIQRIVAQLEESADYAKRREAIREFNAKSRYVKAGHRTDAGEIRHLFHQDGVQSGRCPGACLCRRFGAYEPWWHGNGAGACT